MDQHQTTIQHVKAQSMWTIPEICMYISNPLLYNISHISQFITYFPKVLPLITFVVDAYCNIIWRSRIQHLPFISMQSFPMNNEKGLKYRFFPMQNKKEVEHTFEVTTKESNHFYIVGYIHTFSVETQLKRNLRGFAVLFIKLLSAAIAQ